MKYEPQRTRLLTIIAFDTNGKPYKYRNIMDTDAKRKGIEQYCIRAHNAIYCNYYDKKTKEFIEQIRFDR